MTATEQSPRVVRLLTHARQALGGDAGRTAITSFRITGTMKSSNRLETGSFEIVCVLPDKFVQMETRSIFSPGETVSEPSSGPSVSYRSTRLGFNGDDLILQPHVSRDSLRMGVQSPSQAESSLAMKVARAGFVTLTLGLFADSFAGVPLQFSDATGPNADAAVQVTGPDVSATLFFDRQTRLPERFGRMLYRDYRDVGGRKVPFSTTDGLDEWLVREFHVNVDIADKVFKPTSKSAG
jgi:hypothetical protein